MTKKKLLKLRQEQERQELLKEIEIIKRAYAATLSNLENITDPDLIDCYIYELNASKELLNTITIPPTEETSILTSPEGQAVANLVQEEAAVQFLKMFYGL